jgi:hypothetical protein
MFSTRLSSTYILDYPGKEIKGIAGGVRNSNTKTQRSTKARRGFFFGFWDDGRICENEPHVLSRTKHADILRYSKYKRIKFIEEGIMEIALIITGGLALMTLFASGFDYLTKRRNRLDAETKQKVQDLERKVAVLESQVQDKNERLAHLEENVTFVTKLIEKK